MNDIHSEIIMTDINTVPALDKAYQILDHIADSTQPLSAAEIARQLTLPRSSTHNILHSLAQKGVLYKDFDNKFHMGAHVLYWSARYEKNQQVIKIFADLIHQQPLLSKHTVTLSTMDKDQVVFLMCHDMAPLGFTFKAGVRVPAAFAATGKAMLSTLADDKLNKLFVHGLPKPFTSRSVASLADLKKELAEIRQTRISLDDGQLREGMYCLGTYIQNKQGQAIAGIAVSFLQSEYEVKHKTVAQALISFAQQVENALLA